MTCFFAVGSSLLQAAGNHSLAQSRQIQVQAGAVRPNAGVRINTRSATTTTSATAVTDFWQASSADEGSSAGQGADQTRREWRPAA